MNSIFEINDHSKEEVLEEFQKLAEQLMNNYILQVGEKTYYLIDIEFYLYSDIHKDGFTHIYSDKKAVGEWRGHYSGLDITIRSKSGGRGGILIRGVYNIENSEKIQGPLKLQKELVTGMGSVFANNLFCLKKTLESRNVKIGSIERKGLGKAYQEMLSEEHEIFKNLRYRFKVLQ